MTLVLHSSLSIEWMLTGRSSGPVPPELSYIAQIRAQDLVLAMQAQQRQTSSRWSCLQAQSRARVALHKINELLDRLTCS